MVGHWRLRTRLIVTFVSLILLGFAGLSLLAGSQISAGAVEDFERSLAAQATLVARSLREPLEHYVEGEESFAAVKRPLPAWPTTKICTSPSSTWMGLPG